MSRSPRSQVLSQPDSINRTSSQPAYAQLANILRQCIASGLLRPGDQLPSEAQLCERYGVSPMTVRRALNILIDEGVILAEQGRGTFVKPIAMSAATFHLPELQHLFNEQDHTTIKLLEARILHADERIARKLSIRVGKRVIYIRRLLCTKETPSFYHREYLIYDPTRPIVEAELEVTALQQLFQGTGEAILKHGQVNIQATLLTDEEAQLLQAPQPMAAFCFEHLFYDFCDKPVSWGWFIGRADQLQLTTQVGLRTN